VILAKTLKNMPISTCCGAETDMTEIGICPDCLEHCDWEDEEEEIQKDIETENQIEEEQINKHLN
jgi:hypothetical protein